MLNRCKKHNFWGKTSSDTIDWFLCTPAAFTPILTIQWIPVSPSCEAKASAGSTSPSVAAHAKNACIHGRVPQFRWKRPLNGVCYVELAACPAQPGCVHFNGLLYHPWSGARTPQSFLFFFFTFTVPQAPSLTGISLGERGAALVCSPPDRPHHRLHANCGGVASMRRPCMVKEEGGREVVFV